MRLLDRNRVPAPTCLSNYHHGQDQWNDVSATDRETIRNALGAMQNGHCAYCECPLENESNHPHIEHFLLRSLSPQNTFVWSNLFWSCSHKERCGKHKDKFVKQHGANTPLLKPDDATNNPRMFLRFISDGRVEVRKSLPPHQTRTAQNTIDAFRLNNQALITMRSIHLQVPLDEVKQIGEANLSDAELVKHLQLLKLQYDSSPFSAAVFDCLGIAP